MPNYVTSRCVVHGPAWEIERFKRTMIRPAPKGHSDEGGSLFDFNAIIPMPACIEATESSTTADEGFALIRARGQVSSYEPLPLSEAQVRRIRQTAGLPENARVQDVAAEYLSKRPDAEVAGRAQMIALLETGYSDWYGWARANWGTKWGSFRYEELESESKNVFTFRFETAWDFPHPVFEKLAEAFPQLSFECATFDEGDNFAGIGWFNPLPGEPEFQTGHEYVGPEIYQLVYGKPKPTYDDDGNEIE